MYIHVNSVSTARTTITQTQINPNTKLNDLSTSLGALHAHTFAHENVPHICAQTLCHRAERTFRKTHHNHIPQGCVPALGWLTVVYKKRDNDFKFQFLNVASWEYKLIRIALNSTFQFFEPKHPCLKLLAASWGLHHVPLG